MSGTRTETSFVFNTTGRTHTFRTRGEAVAARQQWTDADEIRTETFLVVDTIGGSCPACNVTRWVDGPVDGHITCDACGYYGPRIERRGPR